MQGLDQRRGVEAKRARAVAMGLQQRADAREDLLADALRPAKRFEQPEATPEAGDQQRPDLPVAGRAKHLIVAVQIEQVAKGGADRGEAAILVDQGGEASLAGDG